MEIRVRDYDPSLDDDYIYSTWTKYAWYSPKERHQVPKQVFFNNLIEKINPLLTPTNVHIACLKDAPYVIIGYLVMHQGNEEWICVKKDFRNYGVETLLRNSFKERIHEEE